MHQALHRPIRLERLETRDLLAGPDSGFDSSLAVPLPFEQAIEGRDFAIATLQSNASHQGPLLYSFSTDPNTSIGILDDAPDDGIDFRFLNSNGDPLYGSAYSRNISFESFTEYVFADAGDYYLQIDNAADQTDVDGKVQLINHAGFPVAVDPIVTDGAIAPIFAVARDYAGNYSALDLPTNTLADVTFDSATLGLAAGLEINDIALPDQIDVDSAGSLHWAGDWIVLPSIQRDQNQLRRIQTGDQTIELIGGHPDQNPIDRYDVDGSGQVTPADALRVINHLAQYGDQELSLIVESAAYFVDVSGDDVATPLDILKVLGRLSEQTAFSASGESLQIEADNLEASPTASALSQLPRTVAVGGDRSPEFTEPDEPKFDDLSWKSRASDSAFAGSPNPSSTTRSRQDSIRDAESEGYIESIGTAAVDEVLRNDGFEPLGFQFRPNGIPPTQGPG
ncbi:dockerin type I domain-containing protein [Planctomycetes bacterium K23_9]|uniref:Uncharacterized protein n=1 Tax=Stieleria marina TaxID=1930275 RepID=A0A517P2I4_9BACT|nr:hypothetical protein K239x_56140 [Planctomycetes bacterium K23_9]